MNTLQIELLKGLFTLAAVAFGSAIGFFVFFRQKEYELTKQRYLEGGIDVVAAAVEHALGVVTHNFGRAVQLCRMYRDLGPRLSESELTRGFLELDSSNLQQTANYRVSLLIEDQIVWEAFQRAVAHAAVANAFMSQQIPDAIRDLLKDPEGPQDRVRESDRMVDDLRAVQEQGYPHATLIKELHVLSSLLEATRLSRSAVAHFHERPDVRAVIQKLRGAYPEAANAG